MPDIRVWLLQVAISLIAAVTVLSVVALCVRRFRIVPSRWVIAALESGWMPIVLGVVAALITGFVWGSLNEPGVIHDERAYVLQAEIFAQGRWTGESPPVPAFFEQMHVFVEPRLAAKYPPGHALGLAPGVMIGAPGMVPIALAGIAGALVFLIVRRSNGVTVAFITWTLWSTSQISLRWRASYLSQSSTTVLWLIAVWACLAWKEDRRPHRLAVIFAAIAWMYVTRPLTAVAMGAPLIFLVVLQVHRERLWKQAATAAIVVLPILLLNFLWQEGTTGNWLTNPYPEYSRVYFPFDKPGFGIDRTAPLRAVPPELKWVGEQFLPVHEIHQLTNLPAILTVRVFSFLVQGGQGWRGFLIMFFLIGAVRVRGPARAAVASLALLFLSYLSFAHPFPWTVYYAEVLPVFFFVAAIELASFGRTALKLDDGPLLATMLLAVALAIALLGRDLATARQNRDLSSAFHRRAGQVLAKVPGPAVVFVRYPENHNYHLSLTSNATDYRAAPLWIVYDRGEANDRLLKLTNRTAYRLDVNTWNLERLRRARQTP